jgi:polyhydroxyalkanoate synthase subunit PhaE
MSDGKSTQDWMKDWQSLQKQYWNAWSDATRGAAGQAPDPATPWHEGLEQWARMFGNSAGQSDTADRLLSSAKNYVSLMQSMLAAASGKMPGDASAQAWSDALRGGFNMPGMDAMLRDNPMAKLMRDMRGPGVQGFDQLSANFAPFLAQMRQESLGWLHAPAFGYAREHQEHYQKMAAAFVEFQDAVGRYNALMLKASQRGFEILENKLAARAEPGRQIDSPRVLYDLWVDAAEEGYAEIALSDEFRKVYGDVVNAQMRVRSQIQQEVEHIGVDLGMPTRSELNSVHRRVHELRRKLRDSEERGGNDDLRREVEKLRAEVAALKRSQAKPVAAVRSAAKPAKSAKGR